jgi:outer membrane murein-binding lipoprotein Lpp
MRLGTMTRVASGLGAVVLMAGITAGCGPSQADKDFAAKLDGAASRTEMAASKTEAAANKAEAAARQAADAAARAQAAANEAESSFQKHMRK